MTIAASPPKPLPDLYGKIGKTIYFPAGSYFIDVGESIFLFQGKVVGHQYFNSNSKLSSQIIIENISPPNECHVYFLCQDFRNLSIETQGSGSANINIYIESVNVSGCYFKAPISIYSVRNPYPPNSNITTPPPLQTVTIQGCQFLSSGTSLYVSGNGYGTEYIINGSVFEGGLLLTTDVSDLVINNCYYMNSSGDYVNGIPPVNNNDCSISAMSPSTTAITITSGTSATNPAYLLTGTIRIPVTLNPTSTAAATVSVAITDQYGNATTTTMASAPAGSTAGVVQTITFDVPPQASYTVTATNATLEEGTISYNTTAVSLNATSVSLS